MKRRPAEPPSVSRTMVDLRADYQMAKASQFARRRTGVPAGGAGADYHYRSESDYLRIIEYARDSDRNDLLVGQGIDRVVDNVLQTGVNPDPQTGDTEADDLQLEAWEEWSEDPRQCHSEHRLNWRQIERTVFRASNLVDGDHWVIPTDTNSLWLVEGHRPRTPTNTSKRVVHGLLLNERDEATQVWLTKENLDPLQALRNVNATVSYDLYDAEGNPLVWQIFDPKRTSQRRGVSRFTPIGQAAGMFDDATFATLLKLQVASCIAIVRELADGTGQPPGVLGDPEVRTSSDGSRRLIEHLFPGMEVVGKLGEKLEMFTPNIATPESMQFSMLVLSIIAVNLGIPVAVLLLDPSNTNFSGWRGAMEQARISFRRLVRDYVQQFHCRLWKWRVRCLLQEVDQRGAPTVRSAKLRAIAERIGTKIFKHRWNAVGYAYIEPLKDATADALRLEKLLTSPRRLYGEKGADWFQVVDEITEDNAYAVRSALLARRKLIEEFKGTSEAELVEKLHWRELLSLTTTANLSININASETPPAAEGANRA